MRNNFKPLKKMALKGKAMSSITGGMRGNPIKRKVPKKPMIKK